MAVDIDKTHQQRRLGRGLAALLGNAIATDATTSPSGILTVPVESLRPSSRNPRKSFAESELDELASSIKERGVLQPILVRRVLDSPDTYEIVAGERRWRAAQRSELHIVPVIVLEITDKDALEISIIENVQRTDLNPMEEAKAYSLLAAEYGYNQTDIGRVVGKSRSHIANTLRLLTLPEHTRDLVASGVLTAGHARAILPLANQDVIADKVVTERLSVREVETLSRNRNGSLSTNKRAPDANLEDISQRLTSKLGANVYVSKNEKGYQLRLVARSLDEINLICEKLLV